MKKKFFNLQGLAFCFFGLMFVVADLNGKWTGTIVIPDGTSLPVTYNFKVSGDTLTGTAESPDGVVSIDDGKVNGDTFSFKVTVDGNDYPHAGRVYDDSCAIDIDFGTQKVHTTLKRATDGQFAGTNLPNPQGSLTSQ